MKKCLLSCLIVFLGCYCNAQSLNPGWGLFRSERFGFSMEYPQNWVVNESGNARYEFYNLNKKLGVFTVQVMEDFSDSAHVYSRLAEMRDDANGSRLDQEGEKWRLSYKTTILSEGRNYEVSHWAIGFRNRIYLCSYHIESAYRNSPDVMEEAKAAFRMIETLNLHITDED